MQYKENVQFPQRFRNSHFHSVQSNTYTAFERRHEGNKLHRFCRANEQYREEDRSIVGCNAIIPHGICSCVSNLGATDAACLSARRRYIIHSVINCVRRTDRTPVYPHAVFKIADVTHSDWFSKVRVAFWRETCRLNTRYDFHDA